MPSNSDYLVIDIKIVGLKVSIDIHLVATVEAVVASLTKPLVRTSVLISIPRHLPQVRVVARGQPGQADQGMDQNSFFFLDLNFCQPEPWYMGEIAASFENHTTDSSASLDKE